MGKLTNSPLNLDITTNYDVSNKIGIYGDPNNKGIVANTKELSSLFRNSKFTPFPQGSPNKQTGYATEGTSNIHNDEVYNISIVDLIDYTSGPKRESMKLSASHFAYLKNIGVYPNNRLMVARRFPGPVGNDLNAVTAQPLATLISWVDNDADFIDITFGEEWIPAKGSFEEILNNVGKDTTLSGDNRAGMAKLGTNLAGGAGVIPLPGLMEGLQQKLFVALGIAATASNDLLLPIGDPNLIKEGMQRKTIEKGQAGSGLKCDFRIKMKVEYEQKYINGVDPTLAYFDLLSNVLSFATSDARFMYNQSFATGTNNLLNNLISGDIEAIQKTLEKFVTTFISVINDYAKSIIDVLSTNKTNANTQTNSNKSFFDNLANITVGAVIGKYKMAILGVISSLTGVASTPWHVTIGNPKRPLFSSGDLWMDNVKMNMGPVLSWNDLPANITIEFELRPARSLGAQEIFNRFNTGKARTYVRNPDIASSNTNQKVLGSDDTINKQNTNYGNNNISNKNNTDGNYGNDNYLKGNGTNVPLA